MKTRGTSKAYAFAAVLAVGALLAPTARADPFRVCADPDNLPFSKAEGPERGLYVELAELVGRQLNRPVEYVWWYTQMQRRALRNTIYKNECDAVFALPADADYEVRGLLRSQPFLQVSYAIVGPPSVSVRSLDDLKGRRIGVPFGSPPQILMSSLDGYTTTTYRTTEEALTALDRGEVDVAFLWGPVAGYENKVHWSGRWRVTPVAGEGLGGQVAVAVRRGQDDLLRSIDAALTALKPQTSALADKYGFPHDAPVKLAQRARSTRLAVAVPAALVATVGEMVRTRAPASGTAGSPPVLVAQAEAAPSDADAGRVEFNSRCSHCHGSDGFSPVRERDVRYLKTRYGDKWQETALTTIKNGRPDYGMPTWGATLSEAEILKIISFFGTIQK